MLYYETYLKTLSRHTVIFILEESFLVKCLIIATTYFLTLGSIWSLLDTCFDQYVYVYGLPLHSIIDTAIFQADTMVLSNLSKTLILSQMILFI